VTKTIALAASVCLLSATARAQTAPPPVFVAQQGLAQGQNETVGVNQWLGIPYASPPILALRWAAPTPPSPFAGTYQATNFSSSCPQGVSQFGRPSTNEDCLYLNVYAPSSAALQTSATPVATPSNLPVMVWIHGGAFVTGEGADYDGAPLVKSGGVIVVTINYRLGYLGFLANAAFAANDAHGSSGNYGLQDQQAAIAWVRSNIASFGGNPKNITIFGESAGGASVEFQLTSPNLGPVRAAIIQSGAYSQSLPTLASAEAAGAATGANNLGCPSGTTQAACLLALPAATIVNAVGPANLSVSPNVDGTTLPQEPVQALAAGNFQHVPVINGSNHDEYRLFVGLNELLGAGPVTPATFTSMVTNAFPAQASTILSTYSLGNYSGPAFPCNAASGIATACQANYAYSAVVTDYTFACGAHLLNAIMSPYTPIYSYELNDPNAPDEFLPFVPDLPNLGDSHAAEIPYLWPNIADPLLNLGPVTFSTRQLTLAATMRSFWTGLARYGRPLAPKSGLWQAYKTQAQVLSLTPPAPVPESNFVAAHNCLLWKPVLLQAAGLPASTPY